MIAKDIVLTAAHCQSAFPRFGEVCIGGNLVDCSDAAEIRTIAQVIVHPNFIDNIDDLNPNPPNNLVNDIMLVRLEGKSSQPLATWNTDPQEPVDGETLTAIGFGTTSFRGPTAPELLEVRLEH